MKGLDSSGTLVHDFLKDVHGFLEKTLAGEKLSRSALEHRSRLMLKLSSLLKEYGQQQMELYISMTNTFPALSSFFQPSLDGSGSSTSDNNSIRDAGGLPNCEEFYEIPVDDSSNKPLTPPQSGKDQCDSSATNSPAPSHKKIKGFMQRFLKSTAGTANNKAPEVETSTASIIYDDAASSSIYDDASAAELAPCYDEASSVAKRVAGGELAVCYDDIAGILLGNQEEEDDATYDDVSNPQPPFLDSSALPPPPPVEDYEYVEDLNTDSDGISVKSGASEYGQASPSRRWHISTSEAIPQAVRHGWMKRRNGRKLLSAWRRCYVVLLPAHFLMYASDGDCRPRIVIDLSKPSIAVRRMVKQGSDTKRIKTHPFVFFHEDKPLYEMSTKNREETDAWISALQSILLQIPEAGNGLPDNVEEEEEEENVYDDPLEVQQHKKKGSVGAIQGRNLPSVPPEEPAVKPSVESYKGTTTAKPINGAGNKLMATIFKFPTRGRSTSSEEESSNSSAATVPRSVVKRQSVDSSTSTDDLYQELPSPVRSNTPYSSVESMTQTVEEDCIYNDVHSGSVSVCPFPDGSSKRRQLDGPTKSANKPPNLPPIPAEIIDTLPVYDVPSPNIRPLSAHPEEEPSATKSFARKMSESRARLLSSQLQESTTEVEVYDVPAPNPKRISDPPQQDYDRVPTPPRAVAPPPPVTPQENPTLPPMQKMARFWQDKLAESTVGAFKKESSPPKCLPSSPSETKSIGRSFSRPTAQRAPLAGMTDLINNGTALKPSAVKAKFTKDKAEASLKIQPSSVPPPSGFNQGVKSSNAVKKDTPPRPPPPARPAQLKITSAEHSLAAELSQQLMKRQQSQNASNDKDLTPQSLPSPGGEQYKTRWAYVAQNALELSVNGGEVVQVLSKSGSSWLVRARSKKGLLPRDYLVPMEPTSPTSIISV